MWYQNDTQRMTFTVPLPAIRGLTMRAVSLGRRGLDVSMYTYHPLSVELVNFHWQKT